MPKPAIVGERLELEHEKAAHFACLRLSRDLKLID